MQILLQLKGAGLVRSTRGVTGGYTLARSPEQISLADVMAVIEGPATVQSNIAAQTPATLRFTSRLDRSRRHPGGRSYCQILWTEDELKEGGVLGEKGVYEATFFSRSTPPCRKLTHRRSACQSRPTMFSRDSPPRSPADARPGH